MESIATSEAPVWAVRELHYFTTFSLYEKRGSGEFRNSEPKETGWRQRGTGLAMGLMPVYSVMCSD